VRRIRCEELQLSIGLPARRGLCRVDINAEEWGIAKVERVYKALSLLLEHPCRNRGYGRIDRALTTKAVVGLAAPRRRKHIALKEL